MFVSCNVYAYWKTGVIASDGGASVSLKISDFDFGQPKTPCDLATLFIDENFFNKYMCLNEQGIYEWQRDQYGNVLNFDEIRNLTQFGTIIKREICFIVIASSYNMIFHGLPDKNSPLDWALMPIGLTYVEDWAYRQNRVIKTNDGQYFMARYYVQTNPLSDRSGWDKIEPPAKEDFYTYFGTDVPNYSAPVIENIIRSYHFDEYTKYLTGDKVDYLGGKYIAIRDSMGAFPVTEKWAWEKL